jgi:hypothetical protein
MYVFIYHSMLCPRSLAHAEENLMILGHDRSHYRGLDASFLVSDHRRIIGRTRFWCTMVWSSGCCRRLRIRKDKDSFTLSFWQAIRFVIVVILLRMCNTGVGNLIRDILEQVVNMIRCKEHKYHRIGDIWHDDHAVSDTPACKPNLALICPLLSAVPLWSACRACDDLVGEVSP